MYKRQPPRSRGKTQTVAPAAQHRPSFPTSPSSRSSRSTASSYSEDSDRSRTSPTSQSSGSSVSSCSETSAQARESGTAELSSRGRGIQPKRGWTTVSARPRQAASSGGPQAPIVLSSYTSNDPSPSASPRKVSRGPSGRAGTPSRRPPAERAPPRPCQTISSGSIAASSASNARWPRAGTKRRATLGLTYRTTRTYSRASVNPSRDSLTWRSASSPAAESLSRSSPWGGTADR